MLTEDERKLRQLEDIGLIVIKDDGDCLTVLRDRAWLESRGVLPYDALPVSDVAEAENLGYADGPLDLRLILRRRGKGCGGVEISRANYERLLDMHPLMGSGGLKALFEASEESEEVGPVGPPLSVAMCEVYVRLGRAFPDRSPSWKKAETCLYFGGKFVF